MRRLLSLGTILLMCSLPAAAGALAPFFPDPEQVQGARLSGETWVVETATHSIQLTPLTAPMRLSYFERVTGQPTDREARYALDVTADGVSLKVVEDSADTINIVLPPNAAGGGLSKKSPCTPPVQCSSASTFKI